jgi:hypothetical protein
MTANSIVAKLRDLLSDGIDSECEVVYLLCEIRKLLEKTPARDRPFALNMYCHWALHVDLHGSDTILPFLQRVDAFVARRLAEPEDFHEDNQMTRDFVMLDTFEIHLQDFLKGYSLPTDLTDDGECWMEFVKHYAGVIEDGSLSFKADNQGLKYVKQITFTKGNGPIMSSAHLPFDMMWQIALLDGKRLDVDVNTVYKDGKHSISQGVHLY